MQSICSFLNFARRRQALQLAVTGCSTACCRYLCAVSDADNRPNEELTETHEQTFDAAEHGAPVVVHQLIGDPRTGIADDTTTTPWGDDVTVEWIWSSEETGVEWYRYSMAGPDQLPFMYMDSRLSDHSKNLMYMLRCKDPNRWTIPALADKFRIRRQRAMAILALKEMEAHHIDQGHSLTGPMQSYSFRIPLRDFHLKQDGEPVDLAELVQQQQSQQQQQQVQQRDAAATAAEAVGTENLLPGLGSLDDFLATDASAEVVGPAASAADESTVSSLLPLAGHENEDLAVLMPQMAIASQQLQLQLLQLLQQHHHSTEELQERLLQQVDMAEAYYNSQIAGTKLEQKLQAMSPEAAAVAAQADHSEAAADSPAEDALPQPEGGSPAPQHAWLDFEEHRRQIKGVISQLAPLLQQAGAPEDQESSRALYALKHALQQAASDSVGSADAAVQNDQGSQQPAAQAVSQVVESYSSTPAVFARAFNQLDVAQRQQLLDLAPGAKVLLNITGSDLRAAVSDSGQTDSRSTAPAAGSGGGGGSPAGQWPGSLPPLIDVWGYEEVPRKLLADLTEKLPQIQTLLQQLQSELAGIAADNGSSSGTNNSVDGLGDVRVLQQAIQVYCTLLRDYDQVLQEQAANATNVEVALLPHAAQRRLVRILRELDRHAIEKLLLWESYCKEEANAEGPGGRNKGQRLMRLKQRVAAAIRQLNQQETAVDGVDEEYPDLPADAPSASHYDTDVAVARLDAEIVGRQFHKGSGDRHFIRLDSLPSFEGYSLEDFDRIDEGELSKISRLAAEREDNMMWKEFREKLLLNIGLTAPNLHQHLTKARPPKPQDGWTWVVHPVGGEARAQTRKELRRQAHQQWLDDRHVRRGSVQPGSWVPLQGFDPAISAAPAAPYAAEPSRQYRDLNEEEAVVAGSSRAKPRKRWYASMRSRPR